MRVKTIAKMNVQTITQTSEMDSNAHKIVLELILKLAIHKIRVDIL